MAKELEYRGVWEPYLSKARDERALHKIHNPASTLGGPQNVAPPIAEIASGHKRIIYDIRVESGVLEVDLIIRAPKTTPGLPHLSSRMEIYSVVCDHVKSVPILVSAHPGWRYGIVTLSPEKLVVETLLQGVASKCGCYPWLDSRTSREIYESLSKWLHFRNQRSQTSAH